MGIKPIWNKGLLLGGKMHAFSTPRATESARLSVCAPHRSLPRLQTCGPYVPALPTPVAYATDRPSSLRDLSKNDGSLLWIRQHQRDTEETRCVVWFVVTLAHPLQVGEGTVGKGFPQVQHFDGGQHTQRSGGGLLPKPVCLQVVRIIRPRWGQQIQIQIYTLETVKMHTSCWTWITPPTRLKMRTSLPTIFFFFLTFNVLVDKPFTHSSPQSTIRIQGAFRQLGDQTRFISVQIKRIYEPEWQVIMNGFTRKM